MSPNGLPRGKKITVPDNIYTAILALALIAVLATAAFIAYKCNAQYGTIFNIPS